MYTGMLFRAHCAGLESSTPDPNPRAPAARPFRPRDAHTQPGPCDPPGQPDRRRPAGPHRQPVAQARQQAPFHPQLCRRPWRERLHRGGGLRPAGGAGLAGLACHRRLFREAARGDGAGPGGARAAGPDLRCALVPAADLREPQPAHEARLRLAAAGLAVRRRRAPQHAPALVRRHGA